MCQTPSRPTTAAGPTLHCYLLGREPFEAVLALQRRLVYEVGGERDRGVLILCEHPPEITVGRQGSRDHVRCDDEELAALGWPLRWVNRGGGCLLHAPGQLAVYPVFALDALGLDLQAYLDRLRGLLADVVGDLGLPAAPAPAGVRVNGRLVAAVGVAVRGWVSYYGAALNVRPDLEPFRRVRCGADEPPMTSLERERHGPVRPAHVRERLLEHFAACFGFARTVLFSDHPGLNRKAGTDAVASPA
jgi:lipoyl(octanoyl) transferase